MKTRNVLLALFSLVLFFSNLGLAQAKREVTYIKILDLELLKSTKQELEALLSPVIYKESGESAGSRTVYYDLTNANLAAYFSIGKCRDRTGGGFDVERDVLIGVDIHYYDSVAFSEFDLNLKKLKRYKDSQSGSVIFYNESKGLRITGDDQSITSIAFFPSEKKQRDFKCQSRR